MGLRGCASSARARPPILNLPNGVLSGMANPRVFTIPASAPFLPTLIRALIDGKLVPGFPAGRDPLALAGATLYLPTRRACRLARDLFLDVTGDERRDPAAHRRRSATSTRTRSSSPRRRPAPSRPTRWICRTALGGLERRMLLAQLVLQWAAASRRDKKDEAPLVANNPASALALADDLARLMDDMTTRAGAVGPARRARAGRARPLLAAHARIPEDRPRGLAGHPRRARPRSSRPRAATR